MADNILQLESTSGFSGANLFVSGGATFTALATFSGGISAAGGVTFGGTINATTAPVGTNTTQVATTAFVQNEIVADAVTAFNGRTGSVQGVSSAAAGTGISISAATGAITITNTGVQTFNGLTGAVTGVTTSVANTFTALQTFNSGISAAGATLANIRNVNNLSGRSGITFASSSGASPNTILLKDGPNDININSGSGTVIIGLGGASLFGTSSKIKLETTDGDFTTTYGTIDSGTLTSNRTYTLPDATGTFVLDTNISSSAVTSYNGRVGAVQGVSSAAAGTGISISAATGAVTITNIGVQSFNGLTGAVGGVTTSAANTFTALQTFNSGITTSFLFASTGSTFGSTLQVNGGATLASTLDVTGVARFAGGVTFSGTVESNTGYRVTSSAINAQTGTTYTLVSGDNGEIITFNNASGITLTIPSGLPVGFNCTLIQLGAGQVGITGASGVTLNSYASAFKISGQHGAAGVISYSSNVYNISGTLSV